MKQAGGGFEYLTNSMVITDPNDFLGIRWGFSSELLPGDPRDTAPPKHHHRRRNHHRPSRGGKGVE